MNRGKLLIFCVIAAFLLGVLTGCGGSGNSEKQEALQSNILSASAELGISDISIISIEYALDSEGNKTTLYVTQAESEQFGTLTHEQMVDFYRDLYKKADVSIQHHIGCQADMFGENAYGGLHIRSGGHEYMYRYHNNAWLLYRDGAVIWDSAEHKDTAGNSGSEDTITIKVPCNICDGDGNTHDAAEDNHDRVQKCRNCGGTGKVEQILD